MIYIWDISFKWAIFVKECNFKRFTKSQNPYLHEHILDSSSGTRMLDSGSAEVR